MPSLQRVVLVGEDLVHHVDDRIARRDQQPLLAIRREVHVAGSKRPLLGTGDSLLTERLHVERHLALPVGAQHAGIEVAHEHHVAKPGELLVVREVGNPFTDRLAVIVEHPHELLAHQGHTLDLLVERRLPHLPGLADEPNPVRVAIPSRRFGNLQPKHFARALGIIRHVLQPLTSPSRTPGRIVFASAVSRSACHDGGLVVVDHCRGAVLFVIRDDDVIGAITVADEIRPSLGLRSMRCTPAACR